MRLGESVVEELGEQLQSDEAYVLAFSCMSNVFDKLRRTSENGHFVTVCAHAYGWCLGQAKDHARRCGDSSAALDLVSRVTGIVDLDESVSLESQSFVQRGSGCEQGMAAQTSGSAPSGAGDEERDIWNAFWAGRCPDEESLSRLRLEVARSNTVQGCDQEDRIVAEQAESQGDETHVAVPEIALSGPRSERVGTIDANAPRCEEGVASTETSLSETRDVPASSVVAVADAKPKRRLKRAHFDEAVPLRRSSRIAERSRPADASAPSGHRRR